MDVRDAYVWFPLERNVRFIVLFLYSFALKRAMHLFYDTLVPGCLQ